MYEFLLQIKMQDEVLKDCMVKWTQHLGHNIDIDHWSQIWKVNIKITKSLNKICIRFF